MGRCGHMGIITSLKRKWLKTRNLEAHSFKGKTGLFVSFHTVVTMGKLTASDSVALATNHAVSATAHITPAAMPIRMWLRGKMTTNGQIPGNVWYTLSYKYVCIEFHLLHWELMYEPGKIDCG